MELAVIDNLVEIPEEVSLKLNNMKVEVQGKNGEIIKDFSHSMIKLEKIDKKVRISTHNPRKRVAAQVNTVTSHIKNMIKGVTKGHIYKMKIVFIHFPMTIRVEEDSIIIENFIGERKPRTAKIIPGVKVTVENDDVLVTGVDIEAVGQTAANIQQSCRIKNKDLRKFLDGIYVYSKG